MMAAPRNYAAVAVCFQMMADMATAILLCWLGTRFVRSGVGMLAGLIWLLYPPAVAISTWITAETLFTTLLVGGAAAFLLSMATRRALLFLLTGLLFGVANLTRGTTTLVPVLLAAVSVRRRLVSSTAIFLTAFALVFTSWYIRNRVVLDDPIPVSVGFGGAFLQGSDERLFTIEGKHATYPEIYAEAARAGVVKPVTDHESVIDHWLFEVGMNNYRMRLAQRPFSFVTLAIDKFFRLWYSTESGGWKGQLLIGLCSLPVVLPGLWRLARWVRRGSDFALVCGVITVYFIGLHLVTGPLNRYMVPMYPILLLAACDWWLDLWSSQSKEQPSVAMSAAPSMHV
jgi:4-amino-4-deoxy-L-arabinose transferase-like glycosyltransferase